MEKKKETFTRRECMIDLKARFKYEFRTFLGIYIFYAYLFWFIGWILSFRAPQLLGVLLVTLPFSPIVYKFFIMCYNIYLVNKGEFSVKEARLDNVEEKPLPVWYYMLNWFFGRWWRKLNAMHFGGYDVFIVSRIKNYIWSDLFCGMTGKGLAMETCTYGDTFYIVTLNRNPKKPLVVYNKKLFKYEDR